MATTTTSKTPPATPPAGRAAPQQAASFSRAPGPGDKLREGAFKFTEAREKLPVKLYTTSGTLASFLYAEAEHSNKADFDKVGQSLAEFHNELAAHSKAKEFLLTPTNTRGEKLAFLKSISKTLKLHPLVEGFVGSMINQNVIREFPRMVQDYNSLLKAREKSVDVSVTLFSKDQPTPKPETVRNLLHYGPDAKINLTVKYDPTIAGGAVIAGPDRILDCSFKRELDSLRAALDKQQRDAKSAKRAEFYKALAQYGDNLA